MKKTLSLGLALVLALSMAVPAFAADITVDGGSGETVVTYGTSQGFTVTIPADFAIDTATKKATAKVSAENVLIPYGKVLNVRVSGHDYTDKWELIDTAEATNKLTYTIGTSEGASDIVNHSVVLGVASGEAYGSEVAKSLYFQVTDTLTKAGTYTDTLTFTVSVDNAN
jgi:hypothetical protein